VEIGRQPILWDIMKRIEVRTNRAPLMPAVHVRLLGLHISFPLTPRTECSEFATATTPATFYGKCKDGLPRPLMHYSDKRALAAPSSRRARTYREPRR